MQERENPDLSIGSNLKIAMFHLGSGMADVLATGVWNRIMVADLGFSATFVGLLTGLRYFLAPLGVVAGRYSDTHSVGGYRRLFWIWLGRAMMVVSTVSLGFATAGLVQRAQSGLGDSTPFALLLTLVISFLLFSLGSAISGSTFLALIYDRAAEHQRGRAVGLVWTFLLIGFATGGIFFSILLPTETAANNSDIGFSADSVLVMFLVAAVVLTLLWFFSLIGEEQRTRATDSQENKQAISLRKDLGLVWRSRVMRFFLIYLTFSMLFAFLQDAVLEPFAGQLFDMDAQITNRFSAYWGTMAILGSFAVLYLSRRFASFSHSKVSQAGVVILIAAYVIFAASSLAEIEGLVRPGLIVLGTGYGIWNIGTLGLMMDMSPSGRAGTFLGFWTFCVTVARGTGVAGGGIVRDIALGLTGEFSLAYGAVFCGGCLGLVISWIALRRMHQLTRQKNTMADEELVAIFANSFD